MVIDKAGKWPHLVTRGVSAITHFTHVRHIRSKIRQSLSTKNAKKVDATPRLCMVDIIPVVSLFEHHKKSWIAYFFNPLNYGSSLKNYIALPKAHLQNSRNPLGVRLEKLTLKFTVFHNFRTRISAVKTKRGGLMSRTSVVLWNCSCFNEHLWFPMYWVYICKI